MIENLPFHNLKADSKYRAHINKYDWVHIALGGYRFR